MTFPQYNYQSFHNKNREMWPIQPPTTENWCKMVNDTRKYCEEMFYKNYMEFEVPIPSKHPKKMTK